MKAHECCYSQCREEGAIHIGANGGNSHWICLRHLERWNQTRTRFVEAGLPCAMEELGELLCDECWDEVPRR
jgi:hypothetical protein